jgi:hypothetical protein
MDMSKYMGNESEWLKASDIKGKEVKVTILSVGEIHFDATDKQAAKDRPTLRFINRDKGITVNPTNTSLLVAAYGLNSDAWIGKEIGLTTQFHEGVGMEGIVIVIIDKTYEDEVEF